jgi:hypothetical protein
MVSSVTESNEEMWKKVCKQWPEMHLINVGVRYARTLSKRKGVPYCRTKCFSGSRVAGDGLIGIGLDNAINMIMVRNHVPLPDLPKLVYDLLPLCDPEVCTCQ